MKKIFLFYLLLLNCLTKLNAQNNLPPALEIKTDTLDWTVIGSRNYQMLEDKEGKWTIAQVTQSPVINNFHDSGINSSIKVNSYWFRYSLKNTMNREAKISLNSISDYDDFYILDSAKKWTHFVSGKLNQWNKKDGFKKADCIPFPLQPGAEFLIYQRIQNNKIGLPKDFVLVILSTDKMLLNYYVNENSDSARKGNLFTTFHLKEAFFIGLLLFVSLFNLFYFGIIKERVYLCFTLFLFFLAINRCYNIYGVYFSVENPQMLKYNSYIGLAWIFIQFFLIHFIRYFFKTWLTYKKWDKFLTAISIALIFIMPLNFIIYNNGINLGILGRIIYEISYYSFLLIFLPLLITLLLYIPQSRYNRFTRLMIVGAFPFIFFYSLNELVDLLLNQFSSMGYLKVIALFFKNNFRSIEMFCTTWFVLFSSRILFLRYSQLQKDNAQQALDKERLTKEKEIERTQIIEQQKVLLEKQVEERTRELKNSLENLKAAQSQLVQSEKMASLGELTAGIAHEIQNPLNFVNNFSDVNKELLVEIKDEMQKGNYDDAKEIIEDVIGNEEKINHHGKRADAIVKGMLQHSRSSNGRKEPTNINALADEYLRLAYHGLRAKDKSLNAILKTDFDESIGNINIIPQDIGRVVLNLITNAFYAVDEKKKHLQSPEGGVPYEPTVTVSTKRSNGKVEISVIDNGNGIPQKVLDKIFQPFFTTKPTGQGTGLGLSLSYDIIMAHGGQLKVETKEREGSAFIIQLPGV